LIYNLDFIIDFYVKFGISPARIGDATGLVNNIKTGGYYLGKSGFFLILAHTAEYVNYSEEYIRAIIDKHEHYFIYRQ